MKKIFGTVFSIILAFFMIGMLIYLLGSEDHANAAFDDIDTVITVNTLDDELNSDGDCSLREAVTAANSNASVDACPAGDLDVLDHIAFDVTGTITLTSQLSITAGDRLVIDGAGAIILSGADSTRIFYVNESADLQLAEILIRNGTALEGGGIYNLGTLAITATNLIANHAAGNFDQPGYGGAIYNSGILTVTNSSLLENTASSGFISAGGAIYNIGTLKVNNSGISSNSAGWGAGISNASGSIAEVMNSSMLDNSAATWGGAILNNGTLKVSRTALGGNDAGDNGGGIYNRFNSTTLTIDDCLIFDNSAAWGGGINNEEVLTVTNSIIADNHATGGGGGGIYAQGYSYVISSTIRGNIARSKGGGIMNDGSTTLLNSTISGNSVEAYGIGGGINNSNGLFIENSTIYDNYATAYLSRTGGIHNFHGAITINYTTIWNNHTTGLVNEDNYGSVTVSNSIVANNVFNCSSLITDGGHNIEDSDSCGFLPTNESMPMTDPLLLKPRNNGGPTWTISLFWNSPAIDAGDNGQCPSTDQRGLPRPVDGDGDGSALCDIGAFELQDPPQLQFLPLAVRSP